MKTKKFKFLWVLLTATLTMLCPQIVCAAGATSSEINDAILLDGSLSLQWENDAVYPWTIQDGWIKNGNAETENSKSSLAFSFTSDYQTEVTFDLWDNYLSSTHSVEYYVDGAYKGTAKSASESQIRFSLAKGNHVIEIVDSIGYESYSEIYSGLKNVRVKEIIGLDGVLLTEKSLPVTFVNDETYPWVPEEGYVQNTNYYDENTTSKLSASISVNQYSKLSFESQSYSYYSDHSLRFYINGELYDEIKNAEDWRCVSVVLQPGEYLLEWIDTNSYSGEENKTQIRNVELNNDWIEVNVAPGTLGVEVLYKVNVLADVELLKINGAINSYDLETIKGMSNIHAIDFSESMFDEVPDYGFSDLSKLSTVILPEGVTSIGESAFIGTQIYSLTIPATVKSIGQEAFYRTRLHSIDFAEDSQLQTIGYQAFYQCESLCEFIMPNTVTTLERYDSSLRYGSETFTGCSSLTKVSLSDLLEILPLNTFYCASNLKEVKLPKNLVSIEAECFGKNEHLSTIEFPESLKDIGAYAFAECGLDSVALPLKLRSLGEGAFSNNRNLKKIELPSDIEEYRGTFSGCEGILTIVCPSATPPIIDYDPFAGAPKESITLVVPSFAVASYKIDSYWHEFGNVIEGNEIDYWKISTELSLLNNRRTEGTPDIDLFYGGSLIVGGNAPMTVGDFHIYISEENPSRLLNSCGAFTADNITTHFQVSADKWYFLTPMVDIDIRDINVDNTPSFVFRYYDGASRAATGTGSSWKNVTDSKLKAGQGYIFQCDENSVVTFPVATELHDAFLSPEAVTISLTSYASDNEANKGWNFVGNPYPCYYDIAYMDFTAPITVWDGETYRAYSVADDDYVLRPMEAFFVQKPDAIDAIVMQTTGKQTAATVNSASYAPARSHSTGNRALFNITIAAGDIFDMTRVVLNEKASLTYEIECDASKFMSIHENVSQIYTIDGENNRLSINERPENDGEVKLGVFVGNPSKTHTISVSRNDGDIYLYDAECDVVVNLADKDYSFTPSSAGSIDHRFILSLSAPEASGVNSVENDGSVTVSGGNGIIEIKAIPETNVTVYGIDGTIYRSVIANADTAIEATPGLYIVKIGNTSYKVVVK